MAAGAALAAAAEPGDTLTVFGGRADLQLTSGMDSPYRYLWSLPMRTLDPELEQLRALLDSDERPTWFVEWVYLGAWTPEAGAALREEVEEHYVEVGGACGGRGGCARRVEFPTETPYPTISGGGDFLQKLLPTTPRGGNGADSHFVHSAAKNGVRVVLGSYLKPPVSAV